MRRRTFLSTLPLLASASSLLHAEQKGTPYYGRTDPARYREVDYGGGPVHEMTILDSALMGTNILYMKRGVIPPGRGIGEHGHRNAEEMYIVFNASAEFTVDGRTALLPAGSSALCPLGSTHALYNNSDVPLEWMTIAASKDKGKGDEGIAYGAVPIKAKIESPAPFRWERFDRTLCKWVGPAHRGKGKILNRRPWLDGNFETNWVRVGHCILPPDTSIGYHRHDGMEEVYYIMSGLGRSTVNGVTWDARAGDALPCTIHDSHGIYNNSKEDLDLFVFMVSLEKDKLDNTDLGDDLAGK
ncbi:MAG: cupin domain-containing protein [Candidatus Latescibacterota bacterium]